MDAWWNAFQPLMNANGKIDLERIFFKWACPFSAFSWKCFRDYAPMQENCCQHNNSALPCPPHGCPYNFPGPNGKNNKCYLHLGIDIGRYDDPSWEATAYQSNSRGGACHNCGPAFVPIGTTDGPFAGGVAATECLANQWPVCSQTSCCCFSGTPSAINQTQENNYFLDPIPPFTVGGTSFEHEQPANNPSYPCCVQQGYANIPCEPGNPRRMGRWRSSYLVQRNNPIDCNGVYPDVTVDPDLYKVAVTKDVMSLAGGQGTCLRIIIKIHVEATLVNVAMGALNAPFPLPSSKECNCKPIVFYGATGLVPIYTTVWYYKDIQPTDPIPTAGSVVSGFVAYRYDNSSCGGGVNICGQEGPTVITNESPPCVQGTVCGPTSTSYECDQAYGSAYCDTELSVPANDCRPQDASSEVPCTPRPHNSASRPRGTHFSLPSKIEIML
jgi:hypothetical protein